MKNILQDFFLLYLRLATQIQLSKVRPLIIGVTGSAGKTSAVKAIGIALETKYSVKYTKKGNSETGLPLEILNIKIDNFSMIGWLKVLLLSVWQLLTYWPSYDILVAEMGIDSPDEPKNMSYLLKIIQPKIGVFLSVTSVHGQNFSGDNIVLSIAQEKAKLLRSLPSDGLAVYSLDYPEIIASTLNLSAPQKTFSDSAPADISLKKHSLTKQDTTFTFTYENQTYHLLFAKRLFFKESFGTFASALLIAHHLGIAMTTAIEALEKKYELEPGRMTLLPGIHDTTIIDSSYNSSLVPTSSSLRLLKQLPGSGRKIAIIGDMRELGNNAQGDHERLAHVIAETVDAVFFVGPLTHHYSYPQLLKLGFPSDKAFTFITAFEALPSIKNYLKSNDIVLVKGSQNTIFLEIIVKELLANQKDSRYLCRQTPYWESQRQLLKESSKL